MLLHPHLFAVLTASLVLVRSPVFAAENSPALAAEPAGISISPIRLNTVGFTPDAPKRATIAAECQAFSVVRLADGAVVFTGHPGAPVHTAKSDTDETVCVADFSSLTTPGRYALDVTGAGRSAPFTIAADVWNNPCVAVTRAFYYWRCGIAVHGEWQGHEFAHGPCHLEDAWLDEVGGGHNRRPSTGGWHDAGDYNKYVVNAGVTVGLMLQAWEQFPTALAPLALQLPESGHGTPDFLSEVRWELEWLFTMQLPDGRVYHKVSTRDFAFWGPPDAERSERFFAPWSSVATADFTAMLAAAARTYRPYDPAFADRCLAAAQRSWAFLVAHPENVAPDLHAFHTGAYAPDDPTHRLWAAVELWETTGDAACLAEFEHRAASLKFDPAGPSWGDARDLAFGEYLLGSRHEKREPALVARLTRNLLATADAIVATDRASAYGRPMGGGRSSWYWGCNGMVAAQVYLLQVADRAQPAPRYRETALDALAHLFGRNYYARSFVTGLGANPPTHPHDRRGEPAWPGYLVGGGWPTGRDWVDDWKNYRVNEIALNWNAALVFALAGFVAPPGAASAR